MITTNTPIQYFVKSDFYLQDEIDDEVYSYQNQALSLLQTQRKRTMRSLNIYLNNIYYLT